MTQFLYFAYGSNMLASRLQARCKSAVPYGIAFAEGYRLEFSKPSTDLSGKGHLAIAKHRQPGVIFKIDAADLSRLDRFEGLGNGYRRDDHFAVTREATGTVIKAVTYLATKLDPSLRPYDWYLALIVAGARESKIAATDIAELLSVDTRDDPDMQRPSRLEACALLAAAGYQTPKDALKH